MHVVKDVVGRDDKGQMLRDEVDRAMLHARVGDPHGSIFGDGEFGGQESEVNVLGRVWIVDLVQIDVARNAIDQLDSFLGCIPRGQRS